MLGLAYEIAVGDRERFFTFMCPSRVFGWMTDRFLAMLVLHVRMSRTTVDSLRLSRISPLTTIVCRPHWGPGCMMRWSGLAEILIDDSRYTYTPVILLSPDLYRVEATMHKSISLALLLRL
jgi:hypothetical protein